MGLAWDGSPGPPADEQPFPRAIPGPVLQKAARMKHGELAGRVGELAKAAGEKYAGDPGTLAIYYNPDSRRIRTEPPFRRGFPDLVIVGPGGALFAELKCKDDTMSPDQRAWRARLVAAGQTWVVWEPVDSFSGRIETELGSLCVRSRYLPAPSTPDTGAGGW